MEDETVFGYVRPFRRKRNAENFRSLRFEFNEHIAINGRDIRPFLTGYGTIDAESSERNSDEEDR